MKFLEGFTRGAFVGSIIVLMVCSAAGGRLPVWMVVWGSLNGLVWLVMEDRKVKP